MVALGCAVLIFVLMLCAESQSDPSDDATASQPATVAALNWVSVKPEVVFDNEIESIYLNLQENLTARCRGSESKKWLCNSDDVLTLDEVLVMEKQLELLYEADYVCPCRDVYCSYGGLPMVLVVLRTFQFTNAESIEEKYNQVRSFAGRLLADWKFDTCDDGAIIVAVANESLAVTLFGKMASLALSLSCKEAIENTTEYIFKEGHFYDGLLELIKEYRLAVAKEHPCNSHDMIETERAVKMYVMIPIILILLGLIASAIITGAILTCRQRRSKDITTEATEPLRDQLPRSEKA